MTYKIFIMKLPMYDKEEKVTLFKFDSGRIMFFKRLDEYGISLDELYKTLQERNHTFTIVRQDVNLYRSTLSLFISQGKKGLKRKNYKSLDDAKYELKRFEKFELLDKKFRLAEKDRIIKENRSKLNKTYFDSKYFFCHSISDTLDAYQEYKESIIGNYDE